VRVALLPVCSGGDGEVLLFSFVGVNRIDVSVNPSRWIRKESPPLFKAPDRSDPCEGQQRHQCFFLPPADADVHPLSVETFSPLSAKGSGFCIRAWFEVRDLVFFSPLVIITTLGWLRRDGAFGKVVLFPPLPPIRPDADNLFFFLLLQSGTDPSSELPPAPAGRSFFSFFGCAAQLTMVMTRSCPSWTPEGSPFFFSQPVEAG